MPHPIDRDLVTHRDYDLVDFDERDQRDTQRIEHLREVVYDLPGRPGVRR
ncbi:hypothetical protein Acy02nite_68720 [Actinoplanes cyaneus]|uniref:Uncharacterized protein n=1 Tax=Actinoplanes cyaneus TaxID=52696 RepID=A0A919MF95_9ACTN|nr:hypothetical protein [Actinoplanes cyaneus]MCW2139079.1 hypothetical protein [Actinoplanes cyaneus]GID68991.1 hypothetical protein Acy02nite_68720 [Actinoplanes cyaneus]